MPSRPTRPARLRPLGPRPLGPEPVVVHPTVRGATVAAVRQVAALAVDGPRMLPRAHRSPWRLLVLTLWGAGIVGDALTTVLMMRTGTYEEANPVAAAGMGVVGVGGYCALVSLLCLGFATLGIGRPGGVYARTVVAAVAVLGALKCWQGISNALLWAGLS